MSSVRTVLWVRASTTVAVPSQLLPTNMTSRGPADDAPGVAAAPRVNAPAVAADVARPRVSATAAVRRMGAPGDRRCHENGPDDARLRANVQRWTEKGAANGSIGVFRCRYPPRDSEPEPPPPPPGRGGYGCRTAVLRSGRAGLSAAPAGEPGS